VQQGRDSKLVAAAFSKWVGTHHRHAEDVRLANSFKDVKKEGESQMSLPWTVPCSSISTLFQKRSNESSVVGIT
jgi:hypothetical protein